MVSILLVIDCEFGSAVIERGEIFALMSRPFMDLFDLRCKIINRAKEAAGANPNSADMAIGCHRCLTRAESSHHNAVVAGPDSGSCADAGPFADAGSCADAGPFADDGPCADDGPFADAGPFGLDYDAPFIQLGLNFAFVALPFARGVIKVDF